jgi:hypothetical protein
MNRTLPIPALRPTRATGKWIAAAVGLAATAGVVYLVWFLGFRQVIPDYPDTTVHFKYGSLGNEADDGIPYWIWLVLPRVFPEYLPGDGGYAAFGMVWEEAQHTSGGEFLPGGGPPPTPGNPGYSVPVGFSVRTVGTIPLVAMNCALCHTTAVRRPGDVAPRLFPGGPAQQLDPQGYIRFLSKCAHDPKFTADRLLPEVTYNVKLNPLEQSLYRHVVIPRTKRGLLDLARRYAWMETLAIDDGLEPKGRRTDWGRGRIDPFNPVKFNVLGLDPAKDNTTGNADMVPIWNLQPREGMALHWDGLNDTIREVMLSSAIGDGSRLNTIELPGLMRVENYLRTLQPPRFEAVFGSNPADHALAETGRLVYHREKCDECHDFGARRTGTIIPVEEVGTDIQRRRLWTAEAAARYNAYARDYPWKFHHFRGTDGPGGGYASVPLDGVWIRAPFLHNGSVPTLRDLLEPPANRPKLFYRGNDLYDVENGGFVSDRPAEGLRRFTRFDTTERANGNGGHVYGTTLPDGEKRALVAYLKTL